MNSPEITGTIVQIFPLQEGVSKAGRPWKSKAFLLETTDRYPKKVAINLFGDHVDKFPVRVGYRVTAALEIESREFNGRWYNDIKAWRILYIDRHGISYVRPIEEVMGSLVEPEASPIPAVAPQPTYQQPQPQQAYQQAYPQQQAVAPSPATPQAAVADDLPF